VHYQHCRLPYTSLLIKPDRLSHGATHCSAHRAAQRGQEQHGHVQVYLCIAYKLCGRRGCGQHGMPPPTCNNPYSQDLHSWPPPWQLIAHASIFFIICISLIISRYRNPSVIIISKISFHFQHPGPLFVYFSRINNNLYFVIKPYNCKF